MDERQDGSGRLLVAVTGPWLVHWLLLRGSWQRFGPPGTSEQFLIHLVCPVGNCDSDDWVTKYEPSNVNRCSKHRPQGLPRQPLEPCQKCARKHGYHVPPEN